MSGFIKRFVLSMVASRLQRVAHRRGHNPAVSGLLNEVNHRLARHQGHGYHHPHGYGHGYGHGHAQYGQTQYGYHGHYRHHGHYRARGYHGHYRKRRRW